MRKKMMWVMAFIFCLAALLTVGAGTASADSIQVTAPASGDSLLFGANYEIKWTTDVVSFNGAEIYFSSDGGATWTLQATQDPTLQSYTWTVPSTATNQARIKVKVCKLTQGTGFPPVVVKKYFEDETGDFTISKFKILPIDPLIPIIPIVTKPTAPSGLAVVDNMGDSVSLSWMDKSDNESGFFIHRKVEGAIGYTSVGSVGANVTEYMDHGLTAGTTYYYVATAYNSAGSSDFSNEASFTAPAMVPVPAAPSDLLASAVSSTAVALTWTDNSTNENGFKLERSLTQVGGYTEIADLPALTVSYQNTGLTPSTHYFYRIKAYNMSGDSSYSSLADATTEVEAVVPGGSSGGSSGGSTPPPAAQTVLRFFIDNNQYYINDIPTPMDTSPVVRDGRTLLPVRYVATPLGAAVAWDAASKKVTVSNNGTVIEMWINKNTARVNGINKLIDPNNASVTPVILPPGRTMLPLRFIAENLGCQVEWIGGASREAKVTYTKP